MVNRPIEVPPNKIDIVVSTETHDLRKADRTRTVLRVVKVRSSDDEGLARLQNISDGGMMFRFQLPLCLGDALTVSVADNMTFAAQVVWTEGESCGVQFTRTIDSVALLVAMAEHARNGSQRPIRLSTDVVGVAYTERGVHSVRVKDVSQHGIKVQHQSGFVEGIPIKIVLASGLERCGIVRWSKGDVAGIKFLESVGLGELGSSKCL